METLFRGHYLELRRRDGWEYVTRRGSTGVVAVVAITPRGEIVLVEQERPPVGGPVVELPAGLVGDRPGARRELPLVAAQRELLEETGFQASSWTNLGKGPVSAGLTDESITFFLATGAVRVAEGGGDDTERIEVCVVPLDALRPYLERRADDGARIDVKIGAALWLAHPHIDGGYA